MSSTAFQETWRTFLAIDIGDNARRLLADLQDRLRRSHPDIKWVAPENIHLTLAFLGDCFPERVRQLGDTLDTAVHRLPVFDCEVAGLGTFGPPRAPRVLWAGFRQGADQLISLQKVVADAIRAFGMTPEDRVFHPHLTLARIKYARQGKGLDERLPPLQALSGATVHINAIQMMRSELRPAGPVYTPIHTCRFA